MARYRVRAIGADFDADDGGCDYLRSEDATRAAVKAGIAIAADAVQGGKKRSIVEVQVFDGQQNVGRFVVALSVEALQPN